MYTLLPLELTIQLGIASPYTTRVVTADSRVLDIRVGMAYLKLLDREAAIPVSSWTSQCHYWE